MKTIKFVIPIILIACSLGSCLGRKVSHKIHSELKISDVPGLQSFNQVSSIISGYRMLNGREIEYVYLTGQGTIRDEITDNIIALQSQISKNLGGKEKNREALYSSELGVSGGVINSYDDLKKLASKMTSSNEGLEFFKDIEDKLGKDILFLRSDRGRVELFSSSDRSRFALVVY